MDRGCSPLTTVDVAGRLENKLRVFKLLTLKDEYAYLLSDDYTALIDRIRQKQVGQPKRNSALNARYTYACQNDRQLLVSAHICQGM